MHEEKIVTVDYEGAPITVRIVSDDGHEYACEYVSGGPWGAAPFATLFVAHREVDDQLHKYGARVIIYRRIGDPKRSTADSLDFEYDVDAGMWIAYQHEPGINQRSRRPDLDCKSGAEILPHIP